MSKYPINIRDKRELPYEVNSCASEKRKTCPFIYRTYHTGSHGGLQFCKEPEGEIGRQHIEGASGYRLSPYVISLHPPRPILTKTRPQHQELRSLLFTNS